MGLVAKSITICGSKALQDISLYLQISSREEYNKDQTGNPSLGGAVGHYNYLYDALLDWPVTREMYLRRLRTLTDKWTNGRIQDVSMLPLVYALQ